MSGRPFLPVYLSCDAKVNLERAQSEERRNSGTTKLTDVAIMKGIMEQEVIFQFEGHPGLAIDNTHKSPAEVAREILDFRTRYSA
jgi:hypothetical protein